MAQGATDKTHGKGTSDNGPLHRFRTLLNNLATNPRITIKPRPDGRETFEGIPRPTPLQARPSQGPAYVRDVPGTRTPDFPNPLCTTECHAKAPLEVRSNVRLDERFQPASRLLPIRSRARRRLIPGRAARTVSESPARASRVRTTRHGEVLAIHGRPV